MTISRFKEPPQLRSEPHLKYVRQKPCCICGRVGVEAHHLLKPWSGSRGMAMKSGDQNVIPLCPEHHRALHHRGNEERFFEEVKSDPDYGKTIARRLWYVSPHYKETR